jgi:hypothetical protein
MPRKPKKSEKPVPVRIQALCVLRSVMNDNTQPACDRVTAALAILNHTKP